MGRFARVVAAGVAHHVTQRGNAKRYILDTDEDRAVYLRLLVENMEWHRLSLLEYCLMSNHVHLVIVRGRQTSAGEGGGDSHLVIQTSDG